MFDYDNRFIVKSLLVCCLRLYPCGECHRTFCAKIVIGPELGEELKFNNNKKNIAIHCFRKAMIHKQ